MNTLELIQSIKDELNEFQGNLDNCTTFEDIQNDVNNFQVAVDQLLEDYQNKDTEELKDVMKDEESEDE